MGPPQRWARVHCTPCTPYCYATARRAMPDDGARVSDDVAGSEGGVPNLNLKRISQSPVRYTRAGKSPRSDRPMPLQTPRRETAAIPASPGCALTGPGGRRGPRLGTRPQPGFCPVRHVAECRLTWLWSWSIKNVLSITSLGRFYSLWQRTGDRSIWPQDFLLRVSYGVSTVKFFFHVNNYTK